MPSQVHVLSSFLDYRQRDFPHGSVIRRQIYRTATGGPSWACSLVPTEDPLLNSIEICREVTCLEAGSNTSTVTVRVVGGDEKGSLESETVKCGHEFYGTRTRR
jgi:hypothetical protein